MCQLTFISLNKNCVGIQRIISYMLAVENSRLLNKDGLGIFMNGRLNKTEKCPNEILNLGELIKEIIKSSGPMIQHVRNASARKLLDKVHAHPFESRHFILAHNGSLEFKDVKKEDEYKDMQVIDSQIFLMEMEKTFLAVDNLSIENILVKTMENFYGKFAFLIYYKEDKQYYIVRGRTADLYISYLVANNAKIGYVVNTEKDTLDVALLKASNIAQIVYGISITYSLPVALKDSMIFKTNADDLVEISAITENTRPVQTTPYQPCYNQSWNGYNDSGEWIDGNYCQKKNGVIIHDPTVNRLTSSAVKENDDVSSLVVNIYNFMSAHLIDFRELDRICQCINDKALVECDLDEFKHLYKALIYIGRQNNHQMKALWRKIIINKGKTTAYTKDGVQFPYFLDSVRHLRKVSVDTKQSNNDPISKIIEG